MAKKFVQGLGAQNLQGHDSSLYLLKKPSSESQDPFQTPKKQFSNPMIEMVEDCVGEEDCNLDDEDEPVPSPQMIAQLLQSSSIKNKIPSLHQYESKFT